MSNRLNLGCGYEQPKDWVNVDSVKYPGDHIVADVLEGLPFPDDHFDFVMLNHVLQMFTYNDHAYVLAEIRRVMKPGATLRILTPDLDKALEMYRTAQWDYFPIADELEVTYSGKLARYLFWHGETRSAFTDKSLGDLLTRNGFNDPLLGSYGECDLDSRNEESLIMEAIK